MNDLERPRKQPHGPDHAPTERFTPEQIRNYMMAAELSIRIGDNDNATKLYKDIGREELVPNSKTQRNIEGVDPKIQLNIERLMRKVVRWLTSEEEWKKYMRGKRGRGGDTHIEIGIFDLHREPEWQALGKVDLASVLGTFVVELPKTNPDHPYEPRHLGIQLARHQDQILFLNQGIVSIYSGKGAAPIPPEDLKE